MSFENVAQLECHGRGKLILELHLLEKTRGKVNAVSRQTVIHPLLTAILYRHDLDVCITKVRVGSNQGFSELAQIARELPVMTQLELCFELASQLRSHHLIALSALDGRDRRQRTGWRRTSAKER